MTDSQEAVLRAAALGDSLREAHRRVSALNASDDEKARAARRLLAISDAAKHDVGRAEKRLAALLAEWDDGRHGAADGADSG